MKLILEFDDFHPHPNVNCLSVIEELVEEFPFIVLNMFVPIVYGRYPAYADKKWCDRVRELIDSKNLCLGVHGVFHSTLEFSKLTYPQAISLLAEANSYFDAADLPYTKVFRGPHWGINDKSCVALINLGYTHLYSHTSHDKITDQFKDDIKIVHYNWNLKDRFGAYENALESDIIVAHGHTSPKKELSCDNSIFDVKDKIADLIYSKKDIEFLRLDEY